MKAVGYVRVSLDKQVEEGISLESQAEKIRAYCLVKDWTLTEIITDEGQSAKTLKREGMARLIEMVTAREVNIAIVAKLDRLTRSVIDVNKLLEIFFKKGVKLVSLAESLDATTATGELMINLLASVSQWERRVIGERTRDAMQHLKAQGRVYCRPVFDNREALQIMKTDRVAGLTYKQIAEHLTQCGIHTTRGGQWQACTVEKILKRAIAA
jgi:site-specific DNA recombinase